MCNMQHCNILLLRIQQSILAEGQICTKAMGKCQATTEWHDAALTAQAVIKRVGNSKTDLLADLK